MASEEVKSHSKSKSEKKKEKKEKKSKKRKERSESENEGRDAEKNSHKDEMVVEEKKTDSMDEEAARLKKKQKKELKKARKESKKAKKSKKEKKKHKDKDKDKDEDSASESSASEEEDPKMRKIVTSSAKYADNDPKAKKDKTGVTLLLFYQYVEPPWTDSEYKKALQYAEKSASSFSLTGRMRVAKEGFNCTLTGSYDNIRDWCVATRSFAKPHFEETEFKLTDHLPDRQRFPKLNCFHVQELVHYGLTRGQTPHIHKTGEHLEPQQYHAKMQEKDTVIIDVRNHYEAAIGHFSPPSDGAQLVDPLMRKSTEFPVWLDKPETKEILKNKQVLMYCTGGVRCERASALLKHKMETEEDTKNLNIKGVYQLQGGIDKYFKQFPEGGFWEGKNYTFDKRFAHTPAQVNNNDDINTDDDGTILGRCEACSKPWDKYRGKRRCPTCGVPSLICKDCFDLDAQKIKKLDKSIRCKLCVEQNITSKLQIKQTEIAELEEYALKQRERMKTLKQSNHPSTNNNNGNNNDEDGTETSRPTTTIKSSSSRSGSSSGSSTHKSVENPENVTRLFVKNMCIKSMDEETLCQTLPGITHIQWLSDRVTGNFYGSAFVEMATPEDASNAVAKDGMRVLGRPIKVKFQKTDGKDVWPGPDCIVVNQ